MTSPRFMKNELASADYNYQPDARQSGDQEKPRIRLRHKRLHMCILPFVSNFEQNYASLTYIQ